MNINHILEQAGGLQSMARELGISENQAKAGATALLPAILGGFKKQTQAQPTGLGGMLTQLGGGGLLDDLLSPQPTNVGKGNDVLGQIFGSKDVSRAVAKNASATSGLDVSTLKKMLPMLAMLVTGFMAKQGGGTTSSSDAGGLLGGLVSGLLGGGAKSGGGGLGSLLDLDGDGNPLDDILGMVGKSGR